MISIDVSFPCGNLFPLHENWKKKHVYSEIFVNFHEIKKKVTMIEKLNTGHFLNPQPCININKEQVGI